MTAHDYLAFLQMIMRRGTFNGTQILRPETVAQMSQNRIGDLNVPTVEVDRTPVVERR